MCLPGRVSNAHALSYALVSDRAELHGMVAAWEALAQRASEPNPFFESWYLLPSLEALAEGGSVEIFCVQSGGRLCGLLPLTRRLDYYGKPLPHIANWVHANIFLGAPLVERGLERAFWQALLAWADANARMGLFLHLDEMPLEGDLYTALADVLARDGRRWDAVTDETRAVLSSDHDAETYRQAHFSTRKRKDLRRRLKKLGERGTVRFAWKHDATDVTAWAEAFLRLEASGWKGEAGSALAKEPATAHILRRSLLGAAERGRLLRLALLLDERPIAMLSTFLSSPGAFGFKTAFDEDYARYAPGILLEQEFMSALDRDLFDWCDSCATAHHPVMNDLWSARRRIGKLSIAIGGKTRRALFAPMLHLETSGQSKESAE